MKRNNTDKPDDSNIKTQEPKEKETIDITEKEDIDNEKITNDISKEEDNTTKEEDNTTKEKDNITKEKDNITKEKDNSTKEKDNSTKEDESITKERNDSKETDNVNESNISNEKDKVNVTDNSNKMHSSHNELVDQNQGNFNRTKPDLSYKLDSNDGENTQDEEPYLIHDRFVYIDYSKELSEHPDEYEIIPNKYGINVYHCTNVTTYEFCGIPVLTSEGDKELPAFFNVLDKDIDMYNESKKAEKMADTEKLKLMNVKVQNATADMNTNGNIKDKSESKKVTNNSNGNNNRDKQKVVINNYYNNNYNFSNKNKNKNKTDDNNNGIINGSESTIIAKDETNNLNTINSGNNINKYSNVYKKSKSNDSVIITCALIAGLLIIAVIVFFLWRRYRRNYPKSKSSDKSDNVDTSKIPIPKNKFNFKTRKINEILDEENQEDYPTNYYTPNDSYTRVITINK